MRKAAAIRGAPRASAFRRMLTTLLVAAYVIVGFSGEISCAEETLATVSSVEASALTGKSDEGSKKAPEVVEHCYTCVPLLVLRLVSAPRPRPNRSNYPSKPPLSCSRTIPGLTPRPQNT